MQLGQFERRAVIGCLELGTGLAFLGECRRLVVDETEQLLARELVGKSRDASVAGAGAVGYQVLALLPQQPRHLLLFARANRAVEQRSKQRPVRKGDDVTLLEIHRHGPENDVDGLDYTEDALRDVDDRLFTATA